MSAGGGSRASSWEEHAGLRTDYQGIHQGVDASEESIGIGYGGLDDVGVNYGVGFGPGDLRMATEDNFSAGSILDYLNNTYTGVVPQSVRNTLINRRADENRERAQWQSDNQTWDMIGGAFDQFQETQQAWNQQQADAQAAANEQATAAQDATRAYQDQMLQAQRQVRTATALQVKQPSSPLAIGPGRVSSPQSAGSLARKYRTRAPVVSGLNIGQQPRRTT